MKRPSNKSRFWKLLEQLGYEVDDGERFLPVGPYRKPIKKDLHGIADLVCIPPSGIWQKGILYFQATYDNHDHDLHLEALMQEPKKLNSLLRFLYAGNHYLVGSYGRDKLELRRITSVVISQRQVKFCDIDNPLDRTNYANCYTLEREAVHG